MIIVEKKGEQQKSNKAMTLNITVASFNKSRVQVLREESLKDLSNEAKLQRQNYCYAENS